ARLMGAGKCAALEFRGIEYPGFEGRPRVKTWEEFLGAVETQVREAAKGRVMLYGTGIGGLILLALRACDVALEAPIVLQGPVLWGLETRRFPLLMRSVFGRTLVKLALRFPPVQWRFAGKYFVRRPPRDIRRAFFRGYAECSAFGDLFRWLGPPLLRSLEESFRAKPARLERISVWWGGKDRVVTTEELRRTESALGVKWPLKEFAGWGHYPMIDAPEEWVTELAGGAILASWQP
ncbi:MAG: alpha/beta hydrolase, partial [Planctomycetes bacterium]|nr:alpha/beta hydrolase [Planctomycetota bacterium]